MPTHDIIDNRTEKLVDHLNQLLGTPLVAKEVQFALETVKKLQQHPFMK